MKTSSTLILTALSALATSTTLLATPSQKKASPTPPDKGITCELWQHLKGGSVSSLTENKRYKKSGDTAIVKNSWENNDLGERYGAQYSAYLTPPTTGTYTFWLAGDDSGQLLISPDETEEKLAILGELTHYTSPKAFNSRSKMGSITLKKGKRYLIRVLHKQDGGGDHIALAWEGPDIKQQIITDAYTTPFITPTIEKKLKKSAEDAAIQEKILTNFLATKPKNAEEFLNALSLQEQKLISQKLSTLKKEAHQSPAAKKTLLALVEKIKTIVPSEHNIIKNPATIELLHAEETLLKQSTPKELAKLKAHRAASSLGIIPTKAKRVEETILLTSASDKWKNEMLSTGFYAAPGEKITVKIPQEFLNKGLSLQVGHHTDARSNSALESMPSTTRIFPINEAYTEILTPHGGIIFLNVPEKVGLDKTPIQFTNVLKAPRFVLGKNTDEEWKTLREAPAPWGELISEHLILLVKSDDLRKLDKPTEIMEWWNENNRRHEDFYGYYAKVPFRMHAALYAREGVSYWPLEWVPKNIVRLLDIKQMERHNDALYLHEHGHHDDFGDMEIGFASESTCNWAGYYMKESTPFLWKDTTYAHLIKLLNPDDKQHNEIKVEGWYSRADKGTHHWSYPITSMMMGYASDFTWQPIRSTIHRLRDKKDPMYTWAFTQKKHDDQAKIDRYLIGLSEAVKYDVRPYFAHFKMMPSSGASEYLDKIKLPQWDLAYLAFPEGTPHVVVEVEGIPSHLIATPGESITVTNPQRHLLTMSSKANINWDKAEQGTLTVNKTTGDITYTAPATVTQEDAISYTISTASGTGPQKKLIIKPKK